MNKYEVNLEKDYIICERLNMTMEELDLMDLSIIEKYREEIKL